ncbi:MAG TPA: tRNA preQ1(34) S-adenosylmethionine ribosyltransferase-isomerase QueA [Anaerolineae bacterium]|jgi:S-adenosylmethionine:tRNA ribosyltransferase-isomerase
MLIRELDYHLPPELIAQTPTEPRDACRLMVIDRRTGTISHHHFYDLPDLLQANDLLVANDSRVIPARLIGRKPTGGKVELLLLRRLNRHEWLGLVGGRNVHEVLLRVNSSQIVTATVAENASKSDWTITFNEPIEPYLDGIGLMPLPPYIHEKLSDQSGYQTVYAHISGSAAAPTAGLHFTPDLIKNLDHKSIEMAFVTLHVGLDTFKPITEEVVESHQIHSEWCELPVQTAQAITRARNKAGRVVAVGTTSVRVLETAASEQQASTSPLTYSGFTRLYITPGYRFKAVDAMITNFHLPRSTLLAMIGAFMGIDLWRTAYAEAIREKYRFYSFGDAMLIL